MSPEGKLLITDPINDKGTYEKILLFYNDERQARRYAAKAIDACVRDRFKIAVKKEINITYAFKGFDDLYENDIKDKHDNEWKAQNRHQVIGLLEQCDQTPEGDFILDYFARVWLLVKRNMNGCIY